jgi:short-subunit dehydrogenase
MDMNINGSIALVTGANGGIGRAFVDELLKRGVAKIYLAARDPTSLSALWQAGDRRLVPLRLDVTDAAQVTAAARTATDVALLLNSAGYWGESSAFTTLDVAKGRREIDVNYFGLLAVTSAFAPVLKASGGGAVLNVLSFLALATWPVSGTYAASKAATLTVTRSLRAERAAEVIQAAHQL